MSLFTSKASLATPLAISPKLPRAGDPSLGPGAIEQVRESLARVETHMGCVQAALSEGEAHTLRALSAVLGNGVVAKDAFDFIGRGEWLQSEFRGTKMNAIRARVDELLALYRPEKV